jgi:putative methyltransferase
VPHVAQSAARKRSRPGADASGGGSDDDEGGEVDGDIVALAAFQLSALLHAFKFPAVRRVSYSTCSVHAAVSGRRVLRCMCCAALAYSFACAGE